jgi:hypothetical protein
MNPLCCLKLQGMHANLNPLSVLLRNTHIRMLSSYQIRWAKGHWHGSPLLNMREDKHLFKTLCLIRKNHIDVNSLAIWINMTHANMNPDLPHYVKIHKLTWVIVPTWKICQLGVCPWRGFTSKWALCHLITKYSS